VAKTKAQDDIFSGKNSKTLWKLINKISKKRKKSKKKIAWAAWHALYALGCHCQQLESLVQNQAQEILKLKEAKNEGRRPLSD
jgi:N-acyl-D-aspartate/D-glutamate deacylase